MSAWGQLRRPARDFVVEIMTRLLTKPLRSYEQRIPNNLTNLKQELRAGDVILVEGDQRVRPLLDHPP